MGYCERYCEKIVIGYRLSVSVVGEVRFYWKGGRMEGLNEARFLLKNMD